MNPPTLTCGHEQRRHAVRASGRNGLDYLEVYRELDEDRGTWVWTLTVCFLGKAPRRIVKENVRIDGGVRVRGLRVVRLEVHRKEDPRLDDCMELELDRRGDFSTYTLRLVDLDDEGRPTDRPMPGLDPRYDRLELDFQAACPSELDCRDVRTCPPPAPAPPPEISYLAKDYASFRQLMLDRMAVVLPSWQDRLVPDLGITLVELLAYAGDHLSYYQDAVATEAYLDTARQRISVRRHARLVDYAMHEGVNARAWVTIEVEGGDLVGEWALDPRKLRLITGYPGAPAPGTILESEKLPGPPRPCEVFEPLVEDPAAPIELYQAHNRIALYTWGDRECCLPRGATRATLLDPGAPPQEPSPVQELPDPTQKRTARQASQKPPEKEPPAEPPRLGHALHLRTGDVLIFEEVKGRRTGLAADADPARRHAVRLTQVEEVWDELQDPPQPVVEIAWHEEDALPFPLCLSSLDRECQPIDEVSVARGNVVLVDHGERFEEVLGPVPPARTRIDCAGQGQPVATVVDPGRFRPALSRLPLVHCQPLPPLGPASGLLDQEPRRALPAIDLDDGEHPWWARRDLLTCDGDERAFVVELDNAGRGHLRFGDDVLGRRPAPGATFQAVYRTAHGPDGNVGAEKITHVVLAGGTLDGVRLTARNPMPAVGGTAPEPLADVKLLAPHAFRSRIERAVTAEDYALLAAEHPRVQRAAARLRRSVCSARVLVAVDPLGRDEADDELLREVAEHLRPYRRIGHEVVVASARYVPLDVALWVCVKRGHPRSLVLAAIRERLARFFDPDELTFGEAVRLSALVAAVQGVEGVESVPLVPLEDPPEIRFERWGEGPNGELRSGVLPLGPFEVARLDNDPNFPENGVLTLELRGGR